MTIAARIALGLCLLWAVGCAAQTKSPGPASRNEAGSATRASADTPGRTFITYEQVDDSLNGKIKSVRYRITYDETDMWRGAPGGPLVTIVDFSDLECPYCRSLSRNLREIVDEYPDDVRVVVKHFPMNKHPRARPAAEAVLAAHAQGKGFEMYEVVFDNSRHLSREDLIAYAEEAGVPDMPRFVDDIDDRTYAPVVDADRELASQFRVRSTPSFFINGKPVSGAKSVEELRRLVQDEKIFARKLIEAGSTRGEVYARIMRAAKEQRWATW